MARKNSMAEKLAWREDLAMDLAWREDLAWIQPYYQLNLVLQYRL